MGDLVKKYNDQLGQTGEGIERKEDVRDVENSFTNKWSTYHVLSGIHCDF